MVKIIYTGDITPCNIKIYDTIIQGWSKGQIRELDEKHASKLLKDNKNFSKVKESVEPIKKKIEETKEENIFDLDGDGDFDNADISLAAKAMAQGKKLKKKEKE